MTRRYAWIAFMGAVWSCSSLELRDSRSTDDTFESDDAFESDGAFENEEVTGSHDEVVDEHDPGPGTWAWGAGVMPNELDGTSSNPLVAVDHAGGAIAVWMQIRSVSPYYGLWSSRYEPGAGWQEPIQVTGWRASDFRMSLAGNGSGDAVVAWNETKGVGARYYHAESGWLEPTVVTPSAQIIEDAYSVTSIKAVINEVGDAFIAWTYYQPLSADTLWSVTYQPTSGWLEPTLLVADGIARFNDSLFDIGLDDAGRSLLVWARADPLQILARRGSPAMGTLAPGWENAEPVDSYYGLMSLKAGLDQAGNATALWVEYSETGLSLTSARAPASEGWSVPQEIVDQIPTSFGFESNQPRVALNAQGDITVLWREAAQTWDEAQTPSSIVGVRYTPELGWSSSLSVAEDLDPPFWGCGRPGTGHMDLALDASGNATILFDDTSDDASTWGVEVWAVEFKPQQSAGAKTLLSASAVPISAAVGVGHDGQVVAVWTRSDVLPSGAWLQTLEASHLEHAD